MVYEKGVRQKWDKVEDQLLGEVRVMRIQLFRYKNGKRWKMYQSNKIQDPFNLDGI